MKKISKVLTAILSLTLVLSIAGPNTTFAATDPGLGAAATFSVIAQTAITGTGTISGNVGLNSTGVGITALTSGNVSGIIYSTDGLSPSAAILSPTVQANLSSANGNLSGQGSTASIGPTLDGLTITTGVYDIGAGRLNGGVLTLDGPGIYILRASSDLVSSGSINLINGARACDVYWQVSSLATINGSSFVGTIIAGTGVHFGANVTLNGRALALGGDVTLSNTTISGPTCVTPVSPTLNVIKNVINNNVGTKVVSDFPLFIDGVSVTSGVANTTTTGLHTVSETADSGYTATIGGDCAANGTITLSSGDVKTCTITNDDITSSGGSLSYVPPVPPLIDVVKVPNPLALPGGAGSVTYTYTLRNIGTVPVSNITMVGDTCSPITLLSGDTNADLNLDLNETWVYTCSATLTETHTNIVTATGWANGISATDIASATVVVGVPVVPPLIHVTKVPNPLTLSSGGGMVTYTNKVTNPGTVALSNIRLTDDKCSPVKYISGDTNGDSKLDTAETWTYTCQTKIAETTVNTVTASGEANGLTAKDFAIATVVATTVPKLPNTGLSPDEDNAFGNIIIPAGVLAILISLYFVRRKQTN
jgi:hypothetical protein